MRTTIAWKQWRRVQGRRLTQLKTNRFAVPLSAWPTLGPSFSSFPTTCTRTSQRAHFLSAKASLPLVDDGAGQPSLSGVHDVGGLDSFLGQAIDLSDPALQDWEQETHALLIVLVKNGYLTTDEVCQKLPTIGWRSSAM